MLKRLFARKTAPTAPTIERKARSAARWAAVMPPADRRVRVSRIERETADSVCVFITPVDAGTWNFRAGQYLTHNLHIDGQSLRRPYSICVAEGARELGFACKRVDGGVVSSYICDRLAVGDEYTVRGPAGDFCLPSRPAPLLLIAAGCGITPIISLLETALARNDDQIVELIYANRDQESIMFGKRLERLAEGYSGLTLRHVLSAPKPGWDGLCGRLDAAMLRQLVTPSADTHVYLCGPKNMMDTLGAGLRQDGVSDERIHCEAFTPAARAVQAHPDQPHSVHFSRTGQSVVQAPGQTILDAALAHGLALDYSCTVGGCAACKVRVIKGSTLLDEPNCLSEAEREQGYTLACSSYALEALEIDA